MLKPAKMQKVRMFVLKSAITEVIKLLHELGVVEINVSHHEGLDSGRPLGYYDEISEQLVKIRGIKSLLTKPNSVHMEKLDIKSAIETARALKTDDELKSPNDELSKNESEISKLSEQIKFVNQLSGFN